MSSAEIKRRLIRKIQESKDDHLIDDIYRLMKDESKSEILLLSKKQEKEIKEAQKQIEKGQYLTDSEVRKRTAKWLGK